MVAPSLRVPVVATTTGTGNGSLTSPALTIDATAAAGDIAWVTATFTAGVDTANPPTHDPAVLSLAGWTPSAQIQSTNDTSTTRTFTKTLVAGDVGSQVSVSSSVAGRVGIVLGIVKGAASVSVTPAAVQMSSTTFTVPGFTPPATETFAVATAGMRWGASVTAPAVPAVTGWNELADAATTNATGQKASIWAASRTPSGTTAVAASSATVTDAPTYGATVLLFTPATGTVTASAGATRTVEADTTVTLTGTTTGGTGSLTAQGWTQVGAGQGVLPRVTRSGSALKVGGTTMRFAGANAYWLALNDNTRAAGVATIPSLATVRATLDQALAMGATILRVHTLGINYGNAEGNNPPTIMPTNGTYNESAFVAVDKIIAEAGKRGLYLIAPMADRWNFYHGGGVTFAKMVLGSGGTLNDFYTNTSVKTAFKAYLSTWLNRVNTVTGVAYKNDTTLAVLELGNEMYDTPAAWTSEMAAHVKSIAPNLLVADPTAASGKPVTDSNVALSDPNVDIFGLHAYPRNASALTTAAAAVVAAGKAFMLGEYDWTTTPQDGVTNTGSTSTPAEWWALIQGDSRISISAWWTLLVTAAGIHRDGYELYAPRANAENATQQAGFDGLSAHSTATSTVAATAPSLSPAVTLTPVPGDPSSVTFTSPLLINGATLNFAYSVTDGNGTSASSSVSVPVVRARRIVNVGGVLTPVRNFVPPPVHPPIPATKLASPFYGGGGQSAFAWSSFSTSKCMVGSDTGGVRTSDDGTRTSSLALLGLDGLRAKQANGLAFSTVTDGVQFMTCGDSTAGTGGVYVRTGAFDSGVSAWTRLDGVIAGSPQLRFNGGNNNLSTTPGAPVEPNAKGTALVAAMYPRMYGGALLRDDTALTGKTILIVATTNDGAWRFVLNNADWSVLEQVRVPGTTGKLARCVAWASKDHSKVVVGLYDSTSPQTPLMLTNATAAVGVTLTTTAMTSSPKNLENVHYLPAPTGTTNSLAVAVTGKHDLTSQSGSVWLSSNLDSAAPGSVSWTDTAKAPGTGASTAPESNEWWFSAGGTTRLVGGTWQHRVFVGTSSGRRVTVSGAQRWNTMWVGTVAASSSTPATAITWKVPTVDEQVLGLAGSAWKWWNAGVNTPTLTGTAAVSGFKVHPSDPNLIAATAKGITYLSTDGGDTWHPSAIGGTSDHNAAFWNDTTNPLRMMTTTGDWPLAATLDKSPAKTFDIQPNAVLQVAQAAGEGGTVDPMTGDVFIMCKTTGGGHDVPSADPNNALLSYTDAGMDNSVVDLTGATDWSLPKDTTVTSAGVSTPAASSILAMQIVYGPGTTGRKGAIIAGRQLGLGMWARSTTLSAKTWTRVTAPSGNNPFTATPGNVYDLFDSCRDNERSVAYFLERGNGVVWRVNVAANGTASAVRLFQRAWSYSVCEGVGFVDIDSANDRLWVSTKDGVWWLDNASTAAHVTGTADTTGAFTAAPWSTYYPGEIPGPMQWSAATNSLWVHTQHFATSANPVYPTNGANGPRSLLIANPTTPGSWARSVVNDLAVTRDPQLRTGLVYPKGCSRNVDGSVITIQQQGSGLYVLRLG